MKNHHLLANALLLALGMTLLVVQAAPAATITVTTSNDLLDAAAGNCAAVIVASLPGPDGFTSLREAICAANNNPGPDNIYFNIPGAGIHTIHVLSALPFLTDDATTINGYTQPGAYPNTASGGPATLRIEINGTGINHNGLNVTSSGNVIRGLAIFGFLYNEIAIGNFEGRLANNNLIKGSYLGTDAGGVLCPAAEHRGRNGVFIGLGAQNNLIGGGLPPNLNLISCNGWEGVGIHGSGTNDNVVSANYIGTDPLGTTSRGNTLDGVRIYGGAQNNIVGGATWGERNVISGNSRDGVRIAGAGTSGNRVVGNYIGLEPDGVGDRSNDFYGVHLVDGARDNVIGGDRTAGEGNVISGNLVGVVLSEPDTMNNTVSGNFIGLDFSGVVAVGNSADGVGIIGGARNNLIGGNTAGARNLISGNHNNGVMITDAATSGNVVAGNIIGLAINGTTPLSNADSGIHLGVLAQNNTIGGLTPGERNIISGNGRNGITIEGSGNIVSGNYIGTDAAGAVARGNAGDGVYLTSDAQNNQIGGGTPGSRNLVSGNGDDGITLEGGDNNRVSGNFIGTNAFGTAILGNADFGMVLGNGAQNNTIGGEASSAGNVIAGNSRDGIYVAGSTTLGNVIANNRIGTDLEGTLDLGNGQSGIELDVGTHGNIIGPGNLVAYNSHPGIYVDGNTTIGNTITQNSIFANTGQGILLTLGAHGGIQKPVIVAVNPSPLTVLGTTCSDCTVELFGNSTNDGQGRFYLGSATADGSGAFSLARTTMPYPYLTATATASAKGTSEFSAVFTTTVVLLTHLPIIVR